MSGFLIANNSCVDVFRLNCFSLLVYSLCETLDLVFHFAKMLLFLDKEYPKYYAFKRNIYEKKTSINERMKTILNDFESCEAVACPFLVCLCVHKRQRFEEIKTKKGRATQK